MWKDIWKSWTTLSGHKQWNSRSTDKTWRQLVIKWRLKTDHKHCQEDKSNHHSTMNCNMGFFFKSDYLRYITVYTRFLHFSVRKATFYVKDHKLWGLKWDNCITDIVKLQTFPRMDAVQITADIWCTRVPTSRNCNYIHTHTPHIHVVCCRNNPVKLLSIFSATTRNTDVKISLFALHSYTQPPNSCWFTLLKDVILPLLDASFAKHMVVSTAIFLVTKDVMRKLQTRVAANPIHLVQESPAIAD